MKSYKALLLVSGTLAMMLLCQGNVWADGGRVVYSGEYGPHRVIVLCSPAPLRAGPIELDIFVQEHATGRLVAPTPMRALLQQGKTVIALEASVHPAQRTAWAGTGMLPSAGTWTCELSLVIEEHPCNIAFPLEVSEPAPRWQDMIPWIMWPALPIGLFCVNAILSRRTESKSVSSRRSSPLQ
jgi:hypothetical protein